MAAEAQQYFAKACLRPALWGKLPSIIQKALGTPEVHNQPRRAGGTTGNKKQIERQPVRQQP